ncbi:MAG TPA: carbohydrate ABC transporter permease [Trebonia sp.]
MKSRARLRFGGTFGMAMLALIAAIVIVPLYWLVVASTKGNSTLFSSSTFVPGSFSALGNNISQLFTVQDGIFGRWLLNSVIYGFVTATLGTYLCTLTGYAVAMFRFRGRAALMSAVLGGLMVPSTVLIVPLFILERTLHLTDSYQGVILPMLVFPFGVYFMSIYIGEAVPSTLLEAARIDGARELQIFNRIALPTVVPGMVTLFLISFIGTWNNYFLPLVLVSSTTKYPLTVGLSIWLGSVATPGVNQALYPQVILGSLVSTLPMLVLFPFLQRYVARGLTVGALAGG